MMSIKRGGWAPHLDGNGVTRFSWGTRRDHVRRLEDITTATIVCKLAKIVLHTLIDGLEVVRATSCAPAAQPGQGS